MKLLKDGEAWLESETDNRWNTRVDCLCGGFVMPSEVKKEIELLKSKYGEPPADLKWGYMKY